MWHKELEELEHSSEDFLDGEESTERNNRTRLVILILVVGLALGYMVYAAFPGNALYFMSVNEFMEREEAQDGRIVRVSGKLVDGSFNRVDNSIDASFRLSDEGTGLAGEILLATYRGVLPDLFFNPHSEIILQGSYSPGQVFEADTILVKCPSKYISLEDELEQQSS